MNWNLIREQATDKAVSLGHSLGSFQRCGGRHRVRMAMCQTCQGCCWIALHPSRGFIAGGRLLKYHCGTHEAAGTLPPKMANAKEEA